MRGKVRNERIEKIKMGKKERKENRGEERKIKGQQESV